MCLIVAVCRGGAETAASRSVTWDSVEVVTRIAWSTSRRMVDSSSWKRGLVATSGGSRSTESAYWR